MTEPVRHVREITCPFCDGYGGVDAEGCVPAGDCPVCEGSGEIRIALIVTPYTVRLKLEDMQDD